MSWTRILSISKRSQTLRRWSFTGDYFASTLSGKCEFTGNARSLKEVALRPYSSRLENVGRRWKADEGLSRSLCPCPRASNWIAGFIGRDNMARGTLERERKKRKRELGHKAHGCSIFPGKVLTSEPTHRLTERENASSKSVAIPFNYDGIDRNSERTV